MDNIRTFFVGVGYKHHDDNPTSTHHFAEIVVITSSNQALKPLLYLLHKDASVSFDLSEAPKEIPINNDAFTMAGEVVSIDKKKKIIYLSNQHTVTYNYLILATGTEHVFINTNSEEFAHGLQILIHALRIKKVSPDLSSSHPQHSGAKNPKFMSHGTTAVSLPPKIQNLIFREDAGHESQISRKCLYEVIL